MASTFRTLVIGVALVAAPILSVASLASTVRADPSAADKASARDLLHEGKALAVAGDHAGARKRFEGAYALVPTPITGFFLARELALLGLLVEAREVLGDIDRMPVKSTESDEGKKSRADAAALYADVAAKIPVLEIAISGAPADKDLAITVDGKSVPAAAAEQGIRVNPGTHTVVATLVETGGATQTTTIDVVASQRARAALVFAPAPATAATTAAKPTPSLLAPASMPPGPPAPLADAGGSHATRWIGLAGLGGGVVVMGVGGLVGLSAKSDYDAATSHHCVSGPCDPTGTAQIRAARSKGDTATIVFGVGAAVAVAGAVVWLTAPTGESKPGVTAVGVGPGSVTIGGVF